MTVPPPRPRRPGRMIAARSRRGESAPASAPTLPPRPAPPPLTAAEADKLYRDAFELLHHRDLHDRGIHHLLQVYEYYRYHDDPVRSYKIAKSLMLAYQAQEFPEAGRDFVKAMREDFDTAIRTGRLERKKWLPERCKVWNASSLLFRSRGELGLARRRLEQFRRCFVNWRRTKREGAKEVRAVEAKLLISTGDLARRTEPGRPEAALGPFREAMAIFQELRRTNKSFIPYYWESVTMVAEVEERRGNLDAAAALLASALPYYQEDEKDHGFFFQYARVLTRSGATAAAREAARTAVELYEERRSLYCEETARQSFTEKNAGLYPLHISLLETGGASARELLEPVLRAKSRHFIELMTSRDGPRAAAGGADPAPSKPAPAPSLTRTANPARTRAFTGLLQARFRLRGRRRELEKARAAGKPTRSYERAVKTAEEVRIRREQQYRLVKTDWTRATPLVTTPVDQLLAARPEALVLEFCQLDDRLLLFALHRKQLHRFTVPLSLAAAQSFVNELRELLETMRRRGSGAGVAVERFRFLAGEYRRLVFGPLAELLAATDRVVISPHRCHHRVPFAILPGPDGRSLLETHRVDCLPALECLVRTPRRKAADSNRVLIFADPTGDLPGARAEGTEVAALFTGADLCAGETATRMNFKQRAWLARVIHYAGHAEFTPHHRFGSRLRLAGPTGGDNSLDAGEIADLHLYRAELVVLSSCVSGLGREQRSDELSSFARSFLVAGARHVLVSLWAVSDRATRELILDFYRAYLPHRDAPRALQAAQRAALARGATPDQYGAFAVIG